ncbi:MAG: AraC family transcriptional regulator [Bacteroidota bacterium]
MPSHLSNPIVEHRRAWTLQQAELNLYHTSLVAERFALQFGNTVITSMISGKKVMHLPGEESFEFLPGQSLIMAAGTPMHIDFPEATVQAPTQCLALTISSEFIRQTTDHLNHFVPKVEDGDQWEFQDHNFHFSQSQGVSSTLSRIIQIFQENHLAKDYFALNALQELLLRIMQTQARKLLVQNCEQHATSHRLAYVVKYIHEHLTESIDVKVLANKACLSRAQFYRAFKQELGLSPVDFINRERVERAKQLLINASYSATDVCYACGFNSLSYFDRVFKKWVGISPSRYQRESLTNPSKLFLRDNFRKVD